MISKKTSFFSAFLLILLIQYAAFAATKQMQPIFNQNVIYQYGFDIFYPGPKDWLGMVQVNDPNSGAAVFAGVPADVRALYLKYDPKKPNPDLAFDPTVEVKVYRNTTQEDSESFLKKYVGVLLKKGTPLSLQKKKIRNHDWSSVEYDIPETIATKYGPKKLKRKIYVTNYQATLFLLQLTTLETEYLADEKNFAESIDGTLFTEEIKQRTQPNPPAEAKLKILSYRTKTGEVYSREVSGETDELYIVKDEAGKEVILNKADLLDMRLK
jgi:hypothetical protein